MASNAKARIDLEVNDQQIGPSLTKAEAAFGKFAKGVGVILAAVGVAKLVGKIKDLASEFIALDEVQKGAERRLESVLKATEHSAGFTISQLKVMASELQNVTTVGDEAILNAQSLLATFKNIRGDVFKDATMAMLDMAEVLGTDVSGGAIQLGKALNDPITGVSALSRVGVSFTEEQKEMIRTLQESGDVMGAQRIILGELASEFGGAATDATGDFHGQIAQASNRMADAKEKFGEFLVKVLEPLLPLLELGIHGFERLVDVLHVNTDAINANTDSWAGWAQKTLGTIQDAEEYLDSFLFAMANWNLVVETEMMKNSLVLADWVESVLNFLTVDIPYAFEYMVEAAKQSFNELAELGETAINNTLDTASGLLDAVESVLTGGDFEWDIKSPFEGWSFELENMPEKARKTEGELRRMFEREIAKREEEIDRRANEFFHGERATAPDTSDVDLTPNAPEFDQPEQQARSGWFGVDRAVAALENLASGFSFTKDDKRSSKKEDKDDSSEEEPESQRVGLLALFEQISDAARNRRMDSPELKVQQQIAEGVSGIIDAVNDIELSDGFKDALIAFGQADFSGFMNRPDGEPPGPDVVVDQDKVVGAVKQMPAELGDAVTKGFEKVASSLPFGVFTK